MALLAVMGVTAGILAAGQYEARTVRRRRRLIEEQLPTVAELLAFAVAAGESPLAALDRIARSLDCALAHEIADVVAHARTGDTLEAALRGMSERIGSAAVTRFVDGMLIALERGTPLAEILRAQAADCRADDRRRLLELAGRKDVAMLVPVVFLILPTVVLVALFPGISALRLVVA
jgi:tight adherence protein C